MKCMQHDSCSPWHKPFRSQSLARSGLLILSHLERAVVARRWLFGQARPATHPSKSTKRSHGKLSSPRLALSQCLPGQKGDAQFHYRVLIRALDLCSKAVSHQPSVPKHEVYSAGKSGWRRLANIVSQATMLHNALLKAPGVLKRSDCQPATNAESFTT